MFCEMDIRTVDVLMVRIWWYYERTWWEFHADSVLTPPVIPQP